MFTTKKACLEESRPGNSLCEEVLINPLYWVHMSLLNTEATFYTGNKYSSIEMSSIVRQDWVQIGLATPRCKIWEISLIPMWLRLCICKIDIEIRLNTKDFLKSFIDIWLIFNELNIFKTYNWYILTYVYTHESITPVKIMHRLTISSFVMPPSHSSSTPGNRLSAFCHYRFICIFLQSCISGII